MGNLRHETLCAALPAVGTRRRPGVALADLAAQLAVGGRPGAAALSSDDRAELAPRSGTPLPPVPEDPQLTPEERVNVAVYETVNRGVVNINTKSVRSDTFSLFEVPSEGAGSGSVLDTQGHILTNFHVIEGAREVQVTLHDGQSYEASLVGKDASNDVAVLKIKAPAAPGAGVVRRLAQPESRSTGVRHRQPVRLGADADDRHHFEPESHAAGARPSQHSLDHPDRRGDQPRQFGRPLARYTRPADRHEHRDRFEHRPERGWALPFRSPTSHASCNN